MANKITNEDIVNMNEAYLRLNSYAAVSRELGFSASTVKKYIVPNYTSKEEIESNIIRFKVEDIPHTDSIDWSQFVCEDWGKLTELSEEEAQGMLELQKEILV